MRKARLDRPNQWWDIDMIKVMTLSGWVYLTIVMDWNNKKGGGWHIGAQSKACLWLEALHIGVDQQFPSGVQGQGHHLMSDNSQPTAVSFMAGCSTMVVEQAFTAYKKATPTSSDSS